MSEINNNIPENEIEVKTEETVKAPKKKRAKLIKNQHLFKKGSVAMAITAAFVAIVIVANVLFSALAEHYHLEFDMTKDKVHTVSEGNLDFIKNLKDEVEIIVCATEDSYASGMIDHAYNNYQITDTSLSDYYNQTIKLINKYAEYNDNISLKFVDTSSAEIIEIASKYSNQNLSFGSVIVSCEKNDNERVKVLNFEDIYLLSEDTSSYYTTGYASYTLTGNNLENALTNALAYVTSSETKTLGFVTGHSTNDATEYYRQALTANNYEIVDIDAKVVKSIPEEVDALVICAPTIDFTSDELFVIEKFLENGGKLGKGLVFFADVTAPYLTNLYDVLSQWGIVVDDGVLFETNEDLHLADDPLTMYSLPASENEITENLASFCLSGYNAPLSVGKPSDSSIKAESLVETSKSVVAAPKGTAASWTGHKKYTKKAYSTLIRATKSTYNDENKEISSSILAFSSVEFINSQYLLTGQISNLSLSFYATESAVGAEDTGLDFDPKIISTAENFIVEESSAKTVKVIFMWVLPIACLLLAVYIYIRRRNA